MNFFAAGERRSELAREAGRAGELIAWFGGRGCFSCVEARRSFWAETVCRFKGGGKSDTDCGENDRGMVVKAGVFLWAEM